jgi:hypothetical protein
MTKTYLRDKQVKKSFALKGVWLLVTLAIIFTVVLVRFAISGTRFDFIDEPPDSEAAYTVAKQFVKPTIKSSYIYFPETGYQCAQKPDSTFIIKSYAESKNRAGVKDVTTFEISIKYIGGKTSDKSSWTVLDLSEN